MSLQWNGFLLFYLQFCCSKISALPSPNSGNTTTQARNARIAATVQELSWFKELTKLHEEHSSLYKTKRIKLKKIREGGYDEYSTRLGKVKTKEDLIAAFSIVSDDPEEVLNFIEKSLMHMSNMKKQLASSGFEEKSINSAIVIALNDQYEKQQAKAKSLRLDCQGACNNGLNISLASAELWYWLSWMCTWGHCWPYRSSSLRPISTRTWSSNRCRRTSLYWFSILQLFRIF